MSGPLQVAVGDLDGDGKPDLTVTFYLPQTVSVFRNTGIVGDLTTNSFAPEVDFPLGGRGHTPAIADLDGDGKPDLAVVTELDSLLSLYRNVSTPGSFTNSSLAGRVDLSTGVNAWGVAVGDLDGDGRPDIVFANQTGNTLSIYQNIVPFGGPPVITFQPTNQTVTMGDTASFSVGASGALPLSYQWSFNTTNLVGATNATLTLTNVQFAQAGNYAVQITNTYGSILSSNRCRARATRITCCTWRPLHRPPFTASIRWSRWTPNIWGLRNLLDAYRDSRLKGLLFFSSSEIYGDPAPEAIPTTEDYRGNVSCVGPRACYDEAKRFGETLCWVFANSFGTPVRVVRPFNNYGPGMALTDRRAPADFAQCVLIGQDMVIHSSGTPTRTFCYVADAVAGYFKALLHDRFEAFNIGIERPEISVRQLAEHFRRAGEKLTGYKGNVVFQAATEKDYLTHNPSGVVPTSPARAPN